MPPINTKNLGLIKAIHKGVNPPLNIAMIWYNDNIGQKKHYVYDTVLAMWVPLAPTAGPSVTAVITPQTLYVDAIYGSDATGTRERYDLPFQTAQAALLVAVADDTITFMPGYHSFAGNMYKEYVNCHFMEGSKNDNIWWQDPTPGPTVNSTNRITGALFVDYTAILFNLTNPGTSFYLEGDSVSGYANQPMRAKDIIYLHIRLKKVFCYSYRCIRISEVNCDIEIDELDARGLTTPYYNVDVESMISTVSRIKIGLHKSSSWATLTMYEDNPLYVGKFIYEGIIEHFLPVPDGTLDYCVENLYGGTMILKDCRITSNVAAVHQMRFSAINSIIVLENCVLDSRGGTHPAIKNSGPDRYIDARECTILNSGPRATIECGVVNDFGDQSNGNLQLFGCIVSTDLLGVAHNVIEIDAACDVAVLNTTLFNPEVGPGFSIYSPNPVNVRGFQKSSGTLANDVNVTIIGGFFIDPTVRPLGFRRY